MRCLTRRPCTGGGACVLAAWAGALCQHHHDQRAHRAEARCGGSVVGVTVVHTCTSRSRVVGVQVGVGERWWGTMRAGAPVGQAQAHTHLHTHHAGMCPAGLRNFMASPLLSWDTAGAQQQVRGVGQGWGPVCAVLQAAQHSSPCPLSPSSKRCMKHGACAPPSPRLQAALSPTLPFPCPPCFPSPARPRLLAHPPSAHSNAQRSNPSSRLTTPPSAAPMSPCQGCGGP